jgi:hypothetical protein
VFRCRALPSEVVVQIFFAVRTTCCAWQKCFYRAWGHGNDLLHGNAVFSGSVGDKVIAKPRYCHPVAAHVYFWQINSFAAIAFQVS